MKASWRKGLSGAVSAIVIAVVLVAGLASASYINLTTARYNEAQMQEALRQARLGSELIRIHIHSTDGAVDSPPRITFVNAWGYESRIIQLVVIARNMTPIATIDLRGRPIVLPPGARLTLEPSQIGLSYPTFKRMADQIRSIHAYTEAGNSFGSTWGFPREDNMAGRTVAVTYNATTIELWNIPSVTWLNRTWTKFYYTTIGEIPPLQQATIKARNNFEKVRVGIVLINYELSKGRSVTVDDAVGEGYPPAPIGDGASIGSDSELGFTPYGWYDPIMGSDKWGYSTWWWYPEGGFTTLEGSPVNVEANTYVAIVNRPLRIVVTQQWNPSYCVVSYRLLHVTLTPEPEGYQPPASSTTTRTGMVVAFNYKGFYSRRSGGGIFSTTYSQTRTAFNDQWGKLIINGEVQPAVLDAPIPRPSYSTITRTIPKQTTTYTTTSTRTIPPHVPTTYVADGDSNLRGVVHRLTTITLPVNPISAIYVKLPPGNYTVDRYYYVDSVQCNIYVPSPEISYSRNVPPCPPEMPNCTERLTQPERCLIYLESKTSPAPSGGGGGGGGGSGGGAGDFNTFQNIVRYRFVC